MKSPPAKAGDTGDMGPVPGSGRSPGGGNGNPLQYSCLENSMDRGVWRVTAHEAAESGTQLIMHIIKKKMLKRYLDSQIHRVRSTLVDVRGWGGVWRVSVYWVQSFSLER